MQIEGSYEYSGFARVRKALAVIRMKPVGAKQQLLDVLQFCYTSNLPG